MYLLSRSRSPLCCLSTEKKDQEAATRERKNNRKNNKKKGKVRIIAGIMTREQESDSTLPPEKEEREIGTVSPWRLERG